MKKAGAELTIGTLVIIVLAIIVLVVVALGFGTGWNNLWSRMTGYFSPVNVDSVRQACEYSCTTQASYAFCSEENNLKFEKSRTTTGSCFDFAEKNPSLGIEDCGLCSTISSGCKIGDKPDINCDGVAEEVISKTTAAGEGIISEAIAISLPEESVEISYLKITQKEIQIA